MNKFQSHLMVVILLSLIGPVWSSALFDDKAANLWLIDTDNGEVTSYGFGDWLTSYKQAQGDLPLPSASYQALVNSLPNSSEAMTTAQPGVSIISLSEAARQLGSGTTGPNLLSMVPSSGSYTHTIGIQLRVEPRQLDLGSRTLRWRWRRDDDAWQSWQSRALTQADQSGAGYIEQSLYIIRDGLHELEAELLDKGEPVAQVRQLYQLYSTDPLGENRDTDGDGVPDLVEQALGLNPLNKDLDAPSHIDGWSRFDLWLRCAAEKLDECTEPSDTDKDGWTDIDETWRGTEPEDIIASNFIDAPEAGSEQERQLRRHFQEFPSARRLYEVEYVFDEEPMGLVPDQLTAASFTGQNGWQLSELVTPEELENAMLTSAQVTKSRLLSSAKTMLEKGHWPLLRLPAADAAFLRASQLVSAVDGEARQSNLLYLPPKADLNPTDFNVADFGIWETANEWKGHYQSWLQSKLVEAVNPVFDKTTSYALLVFEQLLAEEARLRHISEQTRLGIPGQRLSWINDLKADLKYRSSDLTLSQLITGLEAALQEDGLLSEDLSAIRTWLSNVPANLNSSSWLQQKLAFNKAGENIGCFISDIDWGVLNESGNESDLKQFLEQCPIYHTQSQLTEWQTESLDRRYRLRLMLLAQGSIQLKDDISLNMAVNDSDNDGLTNVEEVSLAPYRLHTLPWLSDTDKDNYVDGGDLCPLDPHNGCTGIPDKNQLVLGSNLSVSKPAFEGTVLLSMQLDRPAVEPVTINYQIWASSGDNAVDGVDFIASSGQVIIQPGQNAVLIPVTLLGGGNGQQFRLEITSVEGAAVAGETYTLIGLTDHEPQAPVANVIETNLKVKGEQLLVLDASASYDPNGFDLTFAWFQTAGQTVSLTTSPDTGFAEFIAPNLSLNESLNFKVTVSNETGLTDTAQINVVVIANAENLPPTVERSAVYPHSRQGVLNIPLADLTFLINDPEGGELSFDEVITQPNGSFASIIGSNLVIDGSVAMAQALGLQSGESNSLVSWRGNGFAYLTSSETEGSRLFGWQPDTGLQVLYQADVGETISNLVADPMLGRLYFDKSFGSNRTLSWHDSEDGIYDVTVSTNFMGRYSRNPNSLHGSGGLYLCSSDNFVLHYLDTAAKTITNLYSPCGYSTAKVQNLEQMCLVYSGHVYCSEFGSSSANLTALPILEGETVISSAQLDETFLFLVKTSPLSDITNKLYSYTEFDGLQLLHEWTSSLKAYDLNTDSDRLIVRASYGDRIEVLSWQVGEENLNVHGIDYFSNTGELYYYLEPLLVAESGDIFWLIKTAATGYGVFLLDLGSNQIEAVRLLDVEQSPVASAYGYQLALSPRGLVLATEHTDGFCYWQRLSGGGELAPVHLESTRCNERLVNEQVEVHLNEDDSSRRFYHVAGGDFTGETLVQILVSDPAGNTVILPIELEVADRP